MRKASALLLPQTALDVLFHKPIQSSQSRDCHRLPARFPIEAEVCARRWGPIHQQPTASPSHANPVRNSSFTFQGAETATRVARSTRAAVQGEDQSRPADFVNRLDFAAKVYPQKRIALYTYLQTKKKKEKKGKKRRKIKKPNSAAHRGTPLRQQAATPRVGLAYFGSRIDLLNDGNGKFWPAPRVFYLIRERLRRAAREKAYVCMYYVRKANRCLLRRACLASAAGIRRGRGLFFEGDLLAKSGIYKKVLQFYANGSYTLPPVFSVSNF
ncbi:hypothetical protein JOL62DRAFT_409243 [Phyllosticta paracitricarpa]|uniref:Uncharacterized protein n=1 Tax=Phyllosticta paracitricarpa TaxID=2016321 RepID=A0ABR1NG02_9PEZI